MALIHLYVRFNLADLNLFRFESYLIVDYLFAVGKSLRIHSLSPYFKHSYQNQV